MFYTTSPFTRQQEVTCYTREPSHLLSTFSSRRSDPLARHSTPQTLHTSAPPTGGRLRGLCCRFVVVFCTITPRLSLFYQSPPSPRTAFSGWSLHPLPSTPHPPTHPPTHCHCAMPTDHNPSEETHNPAPSKHTARPEAPPGCCLAAFKRRLNMSQLLCSGLRQQL